MSNKREKKSPSPLRSQTKSDGRQKWRFVLSLNEEQLKAVSEAARRSTQTPQEWAESVLFGRGTPAISPYPTTPSTPQAPFRFPTPAQTIPEGGFLANVPHQSNLPAPAAAIPDGYQRTADGTLWKPGMPVPRGYKTIADGRFIVPEDVLRDLERASG